MTRHVVLDTETTGLEWQQGDRLIEIGCVELVGRRRTQRHFHCYVNPEREVPEGAARVHGIRTEFLLDKPKFRDVAAEFLDFVVGAELVIHNAAFDIGFLNHELSLIGLPPLTDSCTVVDTVKMAREMFPGRKANLDALCERFEIDNSHRELHGALRDAELLVEVYLAMTRGQESLVMDLPETGARGADTAAFAQRGPLRLLRASPEELLEHQRVLGEIDKASGGKCLWLLGEPPAVPPEPPAVAPE